VVLRGDDCAAADVADMHSSALYVAASRHYRDALHRGHRSLWRASARVASFAPWTSSSCLVLRRREVFAGYSKTAAMYRRVNARYRALDGVRVVVAATGALSRRLPCSFMHHRRGCRHFCHWLLLQLMSRNRADAGAVSRAVVGAASCGSVRPPVRSVRRDARASCSVHRGFRTGLKPRFTRTAWRSCRSLRAAATVCVSRCSCGISG
jgi:hypothetical protein